MTSGATVPVLTTKVRAQLTRASPWGAATSRVLWSSARHRKRGITLVADVIGRAHDLCSLFLERTSPARGPVPHVYLVALLEQPFGQRVPHPAQPDHRDLHALFPCVCPSVGAA